MSAYAHLALRLRLRLRLRRSSLFLCKPRLPELRHPFIASVLLSPILCSSDVCLVGLRGLGCGHSGRLGGDFGFSTRLRNVITFFLMATTFFACSAASAAATAASRSAPAVEQSERGQLQAQRGTPPSLLQRPLRIGPFYSATRFWSSSNTHGYCALFSPVLIGAELSPCELFDRLP
jgi:hypothetical protein